MYLDISYTKIKVLYCILYNIKLRTVQDNREEKDGYGALNGNITLLVYLQYLQWMILDFTHVKKMCIKK